MDHPIYDVWVLDCPAPETKAVKEESVSGEAREGEGLVDEDAAPAQPDIDE